MRIEAAIFDVDGTLLTGRRGLTDALMEGMKGAHAALVKGGLPLPDFRTSFSLFLHEMTRSAAALAYGNHREASIPKALEGFLLKAFPQAGKAVIDAAIDALYEPLGASSRRAPGAAEALDLARSRGIRTAAAGNSAFGAKYVERDLKREGLFDKLDAVVCSADVGYRKPNVFLFRRALELLGASGERSVHVGDDPVEDVEAPQETGMIAVLIAPAGKAVRADMTIRSLDELGAALDEIAGM